MPSLFPQIILALLVAVVIVVLTVVVIFVIKKVQGKLNQKGYFQVLLLNQLKVKFV